MRPKKGMLAWVPEMMTILPDKPGERKGRGRLSHCA